MSLLAHLLCDQENRYGTCAARSRSAHGEVEAIALAESEGWYFRRGRDGVPDRALCPTHAGARRNAQ
jgi:hypothetical protein